MICFVLFQRFNEKLNLIQIRLDAITSEMNTVFKDIKIMYYFITTWIYQFAQ